MRLHVKRRRVVGGNLFQLVHTKTISLLTKVRGERSVSVLCVCFFFVLDAYLDVWVWHFVGDFPVVATDTHAPATHSVT